MIDQAEGTAEVIRRAARKALYQRDFEAFALQELRIQTKHRKLMAFKLREFQSYLYWKMTEQEKLHGWIRQVWLKNRQLGTSTLSQGIIFHRTALSSQVNSLVVAHDNPTVQMILKMCGRFYDNMSEWLRPMKRYSTKTELVFDNPSDKERLMNPGLASRINVATAKNIHSGAGGTYHNYHLSEAARYSNAEDIESSTLQSIGFIPGTVGIIESTARPEGDWFHALCEEARAGRSPFNFEFIGWNKDIDCQAPLIHPDELGKLSKEEKELVREFDLTKEQLKWRRLKIAEMRGDLDQFHQEYPLTYEEAWVTPGLEVFKREHLRILKRLLTAPIGRFDVLPGPRIFDVGDGPLEIWEMPQPGAMYDIGADVALGVEGGNRSVASVTKRPHGEQVALYRGHIEPGDYATTLYWLGMFYNTAQIGVEINSIGYYTNAKLSERYPNIYLWRHRDESAPKLSRKTGWETSYKTKKYMVALAVDLITRYVTSDSKERYRLIKSEQLWKEMWSFMESEDTEGSYRAAPGHDDDCVIAWMISQVLNDDETYGQMVDGDGEKRPEVDPNDLSKPGVTIIDPAQRMGADEALVGEYNPFNYTTVGWGRESYDSGHWRG